MVLLGVIIYVATNKGHIKIEVHDPKAVVKIDGDEVRIEALGEPITLRAGEHELTVKWGDGEFTTKKFEIKRGVLLEYDPKGDGLANKSPVPPAAPGSSGESLFNGSDLRGWVFDKCDDRMWRVENQTLVAFNPDGRGQGADGRGRLLTEKSFKEFVFRFEYQASSDFVFGVGWWTLPGEIPPLFHPATSNLGLAMNRGGGRFHSKGKKSELKGGDGWNVIEVEARDRLIRISVNGKETNRRELPEKPAEPTALKTTKPAGAFPRTGIDRRYGRVGFEVNKGGTGRFRNIEINELPLSPAVEWSSPKPTMKLEEDLVEETVGGPGGLPTRAIEGPARPEVDKPSVPLTVVPKEITNSIGMRLVLIPSGEFLMGSPASDKDAGQNEKPQHRVRITRSFYLGATEVTQGQYRAVTGQSPSSFKGSDDLPVETVSWNEAIGFCDRLNELEKGHLGGARYRLPTEAEWEYACRGGSTTRYSFGDDAASLGEFAWYRDNSGRETHRVGQKRSNAFNLYDMHGNVWELCQDWYVKDYYGRSPVADPPGPPQAENRVGRGRGWDSPPLGCRSASRFGSKPGYRNKNLGFRLARVLSVHPEAGTGSLPTDADKAPTRALVVKPPVPPAAEKSSLPPTHIIYVDESS
jgi:formylglycine-generating enzyme required for sulfatase activity